MNAEFVEKMLRAKRLEAQAVASLVPEDARAVVASAVRVCSAAALDVLEVPGTSSRAHTSAPGVDRSGSAASVSDCAEGGVTEGSCSAGQRTQRAQSGIRSIVIE